MNVRTELAVLLMQHTLMLLVLNKHFINCQMHAVVLKLMSVHALTYTLIIGEPIALIFDILYRAMIVSQMKAHIARGSTKILH